VVLAHLIMAKTLYHAQNRSRSHSILATAQAVAIHMVRTQTSTGMAALTKCPLFDGMSAAGIDRVRQSVRFLDFEPQREIISVGDRSDGVSILLTGLARVTLYSPEGHTVGFRRLEAGDLFGEFAAIDGRPRSASVEAAEPCRVARLEAPLFWELMRQEPSFSGAVLWHLVELSRNLTERIYEFSTLAVNNRIHAELLRMARHGVVQSGRPWIDPAPTHAEMAAHISTHREAVSRELSRLMILGLIGKRGSAMVVKDMARLERMVRDAVGE
jgi:CRP/FNR family transcriptional regulator, cyclic AMP receptor protein